MKIPLGSLLSLAPHTLATTSMLGYFITCGCLANHATRPVAEISAILDEYETRTGNNIPIHVDAASGGFIAPFTHAKAGAKW